MHENEKSFGEFSLSKSRGIKRPSKHKWKLISLQSFVHVSTAYSNCHLSVIEERVYENPFPPYQWEEHIFNNKDIKHPNTYTYSKSLTEEVVASYNEKLPVCIVRPSIIGCALKEPYEGWIDHKNGISGNQYAL